MKRAFLFWFVAVFFPRAQDTVKKLYFSGTAEHFFIDTEYTNLIADGLTEAGFQGQIAGNFRITSRWILSSGVFVFQHWGAGSKTRIKPLFFIERQTKNNRFRMGYLDRSQRKKMWPMLYDHRQYFRFDRLETGVQYFYASPHFEGEIWLDWHRFIHTADTLREILNVGFRGQYTLLQKANWEWNFPLQFTIHHRGGQVNLRGNYLSGRNNMLTVLNIGSGMDISYKREHGAQVVFFARGMFHTMNSDNPEDLIFHKGWAYWTGIHVFMPRWMYGISFWKSQQFMSPLGEDIYMSASRRIDKYLDANGQPLPIFSRHTEPRRMLVINKVEYYQNISRHFLMKWGAEAFFQPYRSEIPGYSFIKPVYNHWDLKFHLIFRYNF